MNRLKLKKIDLFSLLVFFYFLTLHADRLNCVIGGFTLRFNNLFAFFLLLLFVMHFRFQLLAIHKRIVYPLLWISLALTLSLILSPYKERCLFYMGWWGVTLLCYFLLPYFLVKMWDQKKVFSLYVFSFLCVGLLAALQLVLSCLGVKAFFGEQMISGKIARPNALCFEPSFYALYMTPFVFMYNTHFIAAFEEPFFIFKKKSFWQLFFINLLYILSTSTSVVFAYFIFFALLFFMRGFNRKKVVKFAIGFSLLSAAMALFLPFLFRNFYMKFFYYGFMSHNSFYERFVGMKNGWMMFLQNPLFGVGFGGYPCYLMDAYLRQDPAFTFIDMHQLMSSLKNPVKIFDAMNVFTEVLASIGLFGFCAFSSLIIGCFLHVKKNASHVDKHLAYSLCISLIITLVVLQFNQGILRTYIWTHLALTFAFLENHSENTSFVHSIA